MRHVPALARGDLEDRRHRSRPACSARWRCDVALECAWRRGCREQGGADLNLRTDHARRSVWASQRVAGCTGPAAPLPALFVRAGRSAAATDVERSACLSAAGTVSVAIMTSTSVPMYMVSGLSLLVPDYIDRDLHRRNRSPVLKPVCCVSILRPAHSRPIVRSDSISMVSERSLQYVDDAWSISMVVNRAEDASRLDGEHTHSKLAPCHALDLRAKVNRCK